MAIGYIQEFEMNDFVNYKSKNIFTGNIFNPFFIVAKRWGQNFHTLIYTGSKTRKHFHNSRFSTSWELNSSFHYMIDGTRNFLGVEINSEIDKNNFNVILRPQMRLGISRNLLIGIVTGIPIGREDERLSMFIRLIYEPGLSQHKAPVPTH
jgi:hypothetical protein